MKGRRKTLVVAIAAVLFGLVFSVVFLACGQSEDKPDARAGGPASAKTKAEAPSEPKFNDWSSHVQQLGEQIEGLRRSAPGDRGAALGDLETDHAQLMAELETIGGENEKWDAVRTEFTGKVLDLRRRIHEFRGRVNE